MGWGQVGQHRASGHKGGLGITGMQKHHYSTLLKDDPDHYGHDSTRPPHPNVTKRWASIRDLDALYVKLCCKDNTINLAKAGYDKLLGGGSTSVGYSVRVPKFTQTAEKKLNNAGGEVSSERG